MSRPIITIADLHLVREKEDWRFELFLDRLEVRPGDQRALIGPSGSGKSTLLDMLALALRPTSVGRFSLFDETAADPDTRNADIRTAWDHNDLDRLADLRAVYTGYILQQGGLLNYLTVGENIALPMKLLGYPVDKDWIKSLTTYLGIDRYLDRRPNQLSVGERQRAGIARAVVHRPKVILADEPTASVDAANALAVARVLLAVARQLSSALIVATHDMGLVDTLELSPLDLKVSQEHGGTVSRFSEP
jgi:putative ABC transport system ATP-binding protein